VIDLLKGDRCFLEAKRSYGSFIDLLELS